MGRTIICLLYLFAISQVGKSTEPDAEPGDSNVPAYLCGNLTLTEVWNEDLRINTSEAFSNLSDILFDDIMVKGDVPEYDNIDFHQFKVLFFDQISADGYDVIANYLLYLGMPADGDTEVVKDLLTSLNIVFETTMRNCSGEVIANVDESLNYQDEEQASFPTYLCGNLTLTEVWNEDLRINTSEAFSNLSDILFDDIMVKGDVPEYDNIDFHQFKVLFFDQISANGYDVIANYLLYLGMPADGDTEVAKDLLTSLNIVFETTMKNCSDEVIANVDESLNYQDEEQASYYLFYGSATLAENFTWNDNLYDNSTEEYLQWKDDLEQPVEDRFGDYMPDGGITGFRTDNGANVVAEFSGILKVVPDFDEHTLQDGMNDMDIFQSVTIMIVDEIPDYSPEEDISNDYWDDSYNSTGSDSYYNWDDSYHSTVSGSDYYWDYSHYSTGSDSYSGIYSSSGMNYDYSDYGGDYSSDYWDDSYHPSGSESSNYWDDSHYSTGSDSYSGIYSSSGMNYDYSDYGGDYSSDYWEDSYHPSGSESSNYWEDSYHPLGSESSNYWDDSHYSTGSDSYSGIYSSSGMNYDYSDYGGDYSSDYWDDSYHPSGSESSYYWDDSHYSTGSDSYSGIYSSSGMNHGDYSDYGGDYSSDYWDDSYHTSGSESSYYWDDSYHTSGSESSYYWDDSYHPSGSDSYSGIYSSSGMNHGDYSDYGGDYSNDYWDDSYHTSESESSTGIYPTSTSNYVDYSEDFSDYNQYEDSDSDDSSLMGSSDGSFSTSDFYDSTIPTPPISSTDSSFDYSTDFTGSSTDIDSIDSTSTSMDESTETPELQSPAWDAVLYPEFNSAVNTDENGVRTWVLSCDFDVVDDFEYKIEWLGDSNILADSGMISADAARTFTFLANNVINTDPGAFFMENNCRVKVYSYDGSMVDEVESEIVIPIEVDDPVIGRGTDANVTLTFNFPLICQVNDDNCYMILKAEFPEDDMSCNRPTPVVKGSSDGCDLKVYGKGDDEDIGTQSVIFGIRGDSEQYSLEKSTFSGIVRMETGSSVVFNVPNSFESTFQVNLTEGEEFWKNSHCYVINDARFKTFDGLFYGITSSGETHTLYRNEEKSAEVQITTRPCSDDLPSASCVCAIYIRCGKDVFVVNFCTAPFTASYVQLEEGSLYVVEESSETYKVNLAHGTSVIVSKLSPSLLNITALTVIIFPAPSDIRQVDGLCGYFDGDMSNDLKHKANGNTPLSLDGQNWQDAEPTAFADSYRVTSDEALYEATVLSDLETIEGDEKYCSCTDTSEVCSIHEKRTCDNQDTEVVDALGRRKRSTELQISERQRLDSQELSQRMKIWKEQQLHQASFSRRKRQTTDCSTLTLDDARDHCEDMLNSMCTEVFQDAQSTLNQDDIIEVCAKSKKDTCEDWEWSTCNAALAVLKNKVLKDNTISEEDRSNAMDSNIFCPNLCSNQGTCNANGCQCDEGFSEDDCSYDSNNAPTPNLFLVAAVVEFSPVNPPSAITMSSYSGFSITASCRLLTITITLPGNSVSTVESFFPIVRISLYVAECPIPSSRKRRSTGSGSSSAVTTYEVSASNDGNTYGNSAQINVLDNTCLTYDSGNVTLNANYCLIDGICYMDGENKTGETCSFCDTSANVYDWTLENGNCLIDGVCYTNGTTKTGDKCKLCNVDLETDEWTHDNETESCESEEDDSGIAGYIIAIIVLGNVLVLAGGAVGGHFLWNKYKLSKVRGAGLFDTVTKNKFTLRVEPTKKEMLAADGINIDPEGGNQGQHPEPEQPPPLYVTTNLSMPNAANVAAPDNLYTDRGTIDSLSTLSPAMAEDSQRPHTPNMPNIEG